MNKDLKKKESAGKEAPRKGRFHIDIYRSWCKQCGICAAFCPIKVLSSGPDGSPTVVDEQKCSGCKLCEFRCPDFAITIVQKEDEEPS